MKTSQLTALVLIGLAGFANAETLVQYHDGTTSTAAYNQAAGITGSALIYASQDAFRTSFGGAGATPAGPTAGTASGSNWRLWRKSSITEALSASDNYAGFTITIGAAADGTTLGDLAFDLAGGGANNATGGIDVNYQVFAQVNGGGFSAVGSPSGFIELLANATINSFSPVVTGTASLSSLGALSADDTVDIRIAVQSEDNLGASNIGLFMQGIKLEETAGATDRFKLTITPNSSNPGNYDFTWESLDNKLYDLVSNTELSTPVTSWPVWEGNADIAGAAPLNTLANVAGGADPRRFFAVIERDPPPVDVFTENFDSATPGSLPDGWTTGTNPADNSSLTAWQLGTPANVGPVPPGVPLPSDSNCVATNISDNYDDPVSDLGIAHTDIWLRSPAIELGTATSGTLAFQQWTQIEQAPGDLDYGSIRILDASDDSVLAVMEDRSIDGSTSGWEAYSMALPAEAFTAAAGTIKVEFRFEADDIDSFAGWYIDDVAVTIP